MILDQLRHFLRKAPLPQEVGTEPLMIDRTVAIHVSDSSFGGQQMANVVQKSRNYRFLIGPGLLGELSALQGVFKLRHRLPEIRIVTSLGEKRSKVFHELGVMSDER